MCPSCGRKTQNICKKEIQKQTKNLQNFKDENMQ